jgi:site-specific DNA-methyltransferase (adenine-specific)
VRRGIPSPQRLGYPVIFLDGEMEIIKQNVVIHLEDCLNVLRSMRENSVDAVVTDPPYGLSFMGKKWDYDVPSVALWTECLRVLKPGGHLLAFAGTRTQHRMACRIEDAGFDIRDMLAWVYGSGWPKSKNLDGDYKGFGSALKPALEPITLARKPMTGTLAENVNLWGTGALNIDGCRISGEAWAKNTSSPAPIGKPVVTVSDHQWGLKEIEKHSNLLGRWPANLIHDGSAEVLSLFPACAALTGKKTFGMGNRGDGNSKLNCYGDIYRKDNWRGFKDEAGSAARFFYSAKANKRDRGEGNNHPTVKPTDLMRYLCRLVTQPGGVILDPFMGSGSTGKAAIRERFGFVGVERDNDSYATARERLLRETAQGILDLDNAQFRGGGTPYPETAGSRGGCP